MNILHVLVTHQSPDLVRRQLRLLDVVTPGTSRLVAYGGSREHFESLDLDVSTIFLEDESIRGNIIDQCFNELLTKTHHHLSKLATSFDFVHVTEYDHLILNERYFSELEKILRDSKCSFLGEGCNVKTGSNWFPFILCREDEALLECLKGISVREIKTELCGCLFNGHTISTQVLSLLVQIPNLPKAYSEVLFPSLVYHLGFKIADVGAYSNIFRYMRHRPEWTTKEISELKAQRALCCHPFKDFDRLNEVEGALNLEA